jgi:histidyl-tRNA synthetase
MVATFDAASAPDAMRVAAALRGQGLRVLVYPDPDKIGKQIKYADGRGIPFVALLGENEIKGGTVTVKDLAAQTQATYDQSAAAAAILDTLRQRG